MSKSSRIEILELLGKGKITAAEAATLLSDAPEKAAAPEKVSSPPPARVVKTAIKQSSTASDEAGKKPSWFHVRVANLETGKNRVSVNIPVGMVKFGMKIGKRFSPEIENLDWNELSSAVQNMESGMLVDVQDEDSNEHVQVYFD